MAVSIQVDKPDIDIRVRTYDGYVEVTGIAAPLVVGDAQVVKGDLVDAGPATTALVVGDAETTKGRAVEGGTSTALVTGDGQTDKGSAVSADGTGAQTVVGDAETDKGEATQGGGVNAPLAVGEVQTEHLKPTHRWQMPQPRNLLSDPESFDPGSTGWESSHSTYAGTVDNVGPNGEAAHRFDIGTSSNWAEIAKDETLDLPSYQPLTVGFLVRAVNVDLGLQVRFKNQDFSESSFGSTTVTTDWQWVVGTNPNGGAKFVRLETQYDTSFNESLYILRAGLNRGSSLEYSTRSQVPQTIPDVVQGADLQNGSSSGADTNDLDFGVDAEGVPYAVSDGDDQTNNPLSSTNGTWVFRFYLPEGESWKNIVGDKNQGFRIQVSGNTEAVFKASDPDGNKIVDQRISGVINNASWATAHVTLVSNDRFEFGVNGFQGSVNVNSEFADVENIINSNHSGIRYTHIEKHPVLTPAEAEAVRQRLAQNPKDPVAPTESWDFTAETSPHNFIKYSEDLSQSYWVKTNSSITTDATTAPDGNTTADKVVENSADNAHGVRNELPSSVPNVDNADFTVGAYLKAAERSWGIIVEDIQQSFLETWFDLSNGVVGTVAPPHKAVMIDVGNGWYWCGVKVTTDTGDGNDLLYVFSSTNDGVRTYQGDGSSGIYVWGAQVVRGHVDNPVYTKTTGSIAFPQTVPALRNSSNDLQLGSTSGADTNDPDWVAPKGLIADNNDDIITIPEKYASAQVVTFVWSMIDEKSFFLDRNGCGWNVRQRDSDVTELRMDNTSADLESLSRVVYDDGNPHAFSITVDRNRQKIWAAGDGESLREIDYSDRGPLPSGSANLYGPFNVGKHRTIQVYTRALTDAEALYARQRILDNPQSPHPEYTNP